MAQDPALGSAMDKFKKAQDDNNYKGQAGFFLNAFWAELGEKEAPMFWDYAVKMGELDMQGGDEGQSLDFAKSIDAKRFMEHFGDAMSHLQLKETLSKIDADNDKRMSLLEFAIWKYGDATITIEELVKRPQGVNQLLKDAQKALKTVQEEIGKIEKKKKKLNKQIIDFEGKVVKLNRAKNELEQLLAADPLPVTRALLTAQAAVRKAEKSSDVNAQGTLWITKKELEIAQSYKPRGNLKK